MAVKNVHVSKTDFYQQLFQPFSLNRLTYEALMKSYMDLQFALKVYYSIEEFTFFFYKYQLKFQSFKGINRNG